MIVIVSIVAKTEATTKETVAIRKVAKMNASTTGFESQEFRATGIPCAFKDSLRTCLLKTST